MGKKIFLLTIVLANFLLAQAQNGWLPNGVKMDFVNGLRARHFIPPNDTTATEVNSFAVLNGQLFHRDSISWKSVSVTGQVSSGIGQVVGTNGVTSPNDSTVKLGGTLTENTTIDADGFNFFLTNGGDFRVYGSGSYSDDRLIQTSGASGIAQMGRGDGAPYYEASDSLREINLGLENDTSKYKIQVINPGTGAKAYMNWIGSHSEVGTITASSSTSLTLSSTETYVFTGSTNATWTLPALGTTGRRRFIKNRGTAILTVQRAGSDQLYTNTTATSMNLLSGDAAIFQDDGTYWIVM